MNNVGGIGIFNEYNYNMWSKYENESAEVVELDVDNSSLFIKFKDNLILEVDSKEFIKS